MRRQKYLLPKVYLKMALVFLGLALLTSVFIYFSLWAKVKIVIVPKAEKVSNDYVFNVKEGGSPAAGDTVNGIVRAVEIEGNSTSTASGSKTVVSAADTVGEVTIINNSKKGQDLVATTRLAAVEDPAKVLVRLKKAVKVPAGQSVVVPVYADKPQEFIDLKPMKFIIPGLWQPLQDKIYAESSQTLSKSNVTVAAVTEEDLKKAEEALKNELDSKVAEQINQQAGENESLWPKLVTSKIIAINQDAKAGDEASEFSTNIRVQAIVTAFDESQVITLLQNKFVAGSAAGKKLVDLDPKSFNYLLQNYDLAGKEASIKVSFSGSSIIAGNTDLIDKTKLIGLTEEEIETYLMQLPEVKSVDVQFQPVWLKKAPPLSDKIEIEIAQ